LIAGMGVSESFPPFSSLPAVPDELESIVQRDNQDIDGILPGVIHLNQAFTPDSFKDVLKGYRTNAKDKLQHYPVLHIASHFKLSPGDYRKSYLLLGDGSHLTLEQLRTRNRYKLTGVDLLTLSACNTAMGGLEQRGNSVHGREVEGFATLAQKRGAKSVLATLWSVSDNSTGLFMQALYQRIKEDAKITKAEALRQVQLQFIQQGQVAQLRNNSQRSASPQYPDMTSDDGKIMNTTGKYSHPYYWAPFILMGNWL
jgi:CHAT domain-containing protein